MEKEASRKLTEEERQKIIFVVNDLIQFDLSPEPTEYDALMKQKKEEFISHLLDEDSDSDSLLEICEEYIKNNGEGFSGFGLIITFDMWLNKSSVWPVMYNPEWDEWNKLKEKKIKND